MTRKNIIKDFGLPIFTTILGAALALAVTRLPNPAGLAELTLDNVFISSRNQSDTDYGTWELRPMQLNDLLITVRSLYETPAVNSEDETNVSLKWVNPSFEKNDLGILLYLIDWKGDDNYWDEKAIISDDILRYRNKNHIFLDTTSRDLKQPIPNELKEKIRGSHFYNRHYLDPDNVNYHEYRWVESAIRYIGSTLEPPKLKIVLRNKGEQSATIYGVKCKNLYSTGGDAGAGGEGLEPSNNQQELFLTYQTDEDLIFETPIVLNSGDTTLLQVRPLVVDATQGEGSGELTYKMFVIYSNGEDKVDLYIGTFQQSDGIEELTIY